MRSTRCGRRPDPRAQHRRPAPGIGRAGHHRARSGLFRLASRGERETGRRHQVSDPEFTVVKDGWPRPVALAGLLDGITVSGSSDKRITGWLWFETSVAPWLPNSPGRRRLPSFRLTSATVERWALGPTPSAAMADWPTWTPRASSSVRAELAVGGASSLSRLLLRHGDGAS